MANLALMNQMQFFRDLYASAMTTNHQQSLVKNQQQTTNHLFNHAMNIGQQAVVSLTRGYVDKSGYDKLNKRNQMLEQYYIPNASSFILFHEGNIPNHHQTYIQSKTIIPLQFINVSDSFKKEQTMEFYDPTNIPMWGLGYRNMCNFWFCDFWNYVPNYKMIVRIDDDCKFESDYNEIFDYLQDNVAVYGYWSGDDEWVTHGLNNFTIEFAKTKKMNRTVREAPSGPYTNVIGLNLELLRQNALVQEYISAIKASNNIYVYRWGDLPLWGEVLKYFYNSDQHKLLKSIRYYHGSLHKQVNSPFKFSYATLQNMFQN